MLDKFLNLVGEFVAGFLPRAVEDKYADALIESGKLGVPAFSTGVKVVAMTALVEVAAADENLSVYRMFPNLSPNLVPWSLELFNDAIAGATDYDIGLYESKSPDGIGGTVIDRDKFMDGTDINAGNALGSPVNALSNLNLDESQEMLYELGGQAIGARKDSYDICITAVVVGTAAGTLVLKGLFLDKG